MHRMPAHRARCESANRVMRCTARELYALYIQYRRATRRLAVYGIRARYTVIYARDAPCARVRSLTDPQRKVKQLSGFCRREST